MTHFIFSSTSMHLRALSHVCVIEWIFISHYWAPVIHSYRYIHILKVCTRPHTQVRSCYSTIIVLGCCYIHTRYLLAHVSIFPSCMFIILFNNQRRQRLLSWLRRMGLDIKLRRMITRIYDIIVGEQSYLNLFATILLLTIPRCLLISRLRVVCVKGNLQTAHKWLVLLIARPMHLFLLVCLYWWSRFWKLDGSINSLWHLGRGLILHDNSSGIASSTNGL